MQTSKTILGAIIALGTFMSAQTANAEGCSLRGVILKCNAEAKTAPAIMKAFASEETRQLLANPLDQKERFSKHGDLEKYRASMEKNWRVITRLAKRQERKKNRARISEEDFKTWSENFSEAEKSYVIALNFYRQLHWQGIK